MNDYEPRSKPHDDRMANFLGWAASLALLGIFLLVLFLLAF